MLNYRKEVVVAALASAAQAAIPQGLRVANRNDPVVATRVSESARESICGDSGIADRKAQRRGQRGGEADVPTKDGGFGAQAGGAHSQAVHGSVVGGLATQCGKVRRVGNVGNVLDVLAEARSAIPDVDVGVRVGKSAAVKTRDGRVEIVANSWTVRGNG